MFVEYSLRSNSFNELFKPTYFAIRAHLKEMASRHQFKAFFFQTKLATNNKSQFFLIFDYLLPTQVKFKKINCWIRKIEVQKAIFGQLAKDLFLFLSKRASQNYNN